MRRLEQQRIENGGSARESVSVSERVKQGRGEVVQTTLTFPVAERARDKAEYSVGQVGSLHLLNEPCQRWGVPWVTCGFSPAQHCGGLHHHRGVQGVWRWRRRRHLSRSGRPRWVCVKHIFVNNWSSCGKGNILLNYTVKLFCCLALNFLISQFQVSTH